MRASFILLGPLLARFGRVIISNPGGDRIGRRPVNLHVDAMRALGAEIDYRNGYYFAARSRPVARHGPGLPRRDGHGHGERAAGGHARRGPHHHPPGGARAGGGRPDRLPPAAWARRWSAPLPDVIEVEGRRRLRGANHHVIPDRIEAGTFVIAAAVTGGDVTLHGAPPATSGRSWSCSRPWACPWRRTGTRCTCAARAPASTPPPISGPPPIRAWPRTSSRRRPCC